MSEDVTVSEEVIGLVRDLDKAKANEAKAKAKRIEVEEKISGLIVNDKLEGSVSVSNNEFSLSVTNGVTRKVDFERISQLDSELPDHLKLTLMKPSLNLKNLRTIEQTAGERFKLGLAEAITIKPKKVSVTLKVKEKS